MSGIPLPATPLTPCDETHVVVAGDWHGNTNWVGKAIPSIARDGPGVRTILLPRVQRCLILVRRRSKEADYSRRIGLRAKRAPSCPSPAGDYGPCPNA